MPHRGEVDDDRDDDRHTPTHAEDAADRHRVVTVGPEVVTRPAWAGSAVVHAHLRHLRDQGLTCVPEPLGVEDGVERLRTIEGEDGAAGWYHQHGERGLASAARLLRRIHDAGAGWVAPSDAVWLGTSSAEPGPGEEVVWCHGDPGPWNMIWRDGEAVGLVDWDYLHPAPRVDDVAYALRWFAPLRSDELARDWHHFPEVPDRRARVRGFLDAYGDLAPFDVAEAVVARVRATSALRRALAERGVEPQRTWVAEGAEERDEEEIAWILAHRADVTP